MRENALQNSAGQAEYRPYAQTKQRPGQAEFEENPAVEALKAMPLAKSRLCPPLSEEVKMPQLSEATAPERCHPARGHRTAFRASSLKICATLITVGPPQNRSWSRNGTIQVLPPRCLSNFWRDAVYRISPSLGMKMTCGELPSAFQRKHTQVTNQRRRWRCGPMPRRGSSCNVPVPATKSPFCQMIADGLGLVDGVRASPCAEACAATRPRLASRPGQ